MSGHHVAQAKLGGSPTVRELLPGDSLVATGSHMTAAEALAFIEKHGVVLVSAKGPVPSLTEAIAGEPIKGSWWGHPKSHQIWAILETVTESEDVLVCRLVKGKITLVHRRLWPALVRLAPRFPPNRTSKVQQEHTSGGRHVNKEVPFPQWVPPEVMKQAISLKEAEAIEALGEWAVALDLSS